MASPAFSIPKRSQSAWRISSKAWTSAGEGATWRLEIDRNGLLETMGGGNIGNGYQMLHGERRVVDRAVLKKVRAKLRKLLATYRRPLGKWSKQDGQGGSCEVVGFGPKVLLLDLRSAVAKKIALMLTPLRRRKIWGNALPFPVARVGYSAELRGRNVRGRRGGATHVTGLVTISGHWRQTTGSGKVRLRRLSPKKLARFFDAVQRAVDARPPAMQPRARASRRPRGVWSVSLSSRFSR